MHVTVVWLHARDGRRCAAVAGSSGRRPVRELWPLRSVGSLRWRIAGLVASAGVVLAGCAASAPVGLVTSGDVVGVCKTITTAEEMITPSDVSPAVSCSSPHVYETYAVTTAPSSITALRVRPEPELLQAAAQDLCPLAPIRPYLGAGALDSQWGVSVWTKFPTRAEWGRGVRLVVCDLVVDAPRPDEVPLVSFSLRDVMASTRSARVRLCRTGPPFQYLTCDTAHEAEKTGTVAVASGLSPVAAQTAALEACTLQARLYTGHASMPGFRPEFVLGNAGAVECWLASENAFTAGTVRGGLIPG